MFGDFFYTQEERPLFCLEWEEYYRKKGRIIPYQAENIAFQVSKLSFQVISPKSNPFMGESET